MAFSQNDPTWKNTPLGFDSPDPSSPNHGTFGMYGCYVTAIANVSTWGGREITPAQVNDLAKQNGWFIRSDLINRDDVPALLCGHLQFAGRTNWTGPTPMNFFDDANDPNVTYIVEIDASKAPGIQTHYTMVWGTYHNGDLEIDDSWDGVRKKLSAYGNPPTILLSAIKFIKTAPQAAPVALQPYQRVVGASGSNYRSEPNTGAAVLQTFAPGSVANFDGWIHGENHSGNDIWFHGRETGHWAWSGSYTDTGPHDLNDLNPPPPPAPAPYVPPAAPVPVTRAEKYEVLMNLPYYDSVDALTLAKDPTGKLEPGSYFVWDKQGSTNSYWNLSTSNMQNQNKWVNTIENKKPLNVPKPTPAPKPEPKPVTITLQAAPKPPTTDTSADVQASWKWFYKSHEPVEYVIAKPYTVRDQLHTGQPITITPGTDAHGDPKTIEIYGTFIKDGTLYLRPLTALDEQGMYNYYGIPTGDIYSGMPYLNNEFNVGNKVQYGADLMIDKAVKTIEGIYRWVRRKP